MIVNRRLFFLSLMLFSFVAVRVPMFADEALDWRETRTEHIVFIYQEKDAEAVREFCGFAEEVYRAVSGYFDYSPKEVRCVLLGNVDVANGAYMAPPHHLELYLSAPTGPWMGARTEGWLKVLFTHELTHYIDLASETGFFAVLSLLFGEGTRSGESAFLPAWTYEGIAVFLETAFTKGGRGRNPFFLMYAKAFILDDVPLTLGHLEYASAYPPPSRYYLFGYLFVDYLSRRYGPDVYREIRKRFLDFPLFGPWGAIRAVTGKPQDELWQEMRRDLKERWIPESGAVEGVAFTPPGIADYHAPVRAGGGWFLYRERPDRAPAIIAYDPVSRSERVLVEALLTDERSFSVSADGAWLAYAVNDYHLGSIPRTRITSDLFLARISRANNGLPAVLSSTRLTRDRHLWHPALSPDGARLYAVQGTGPYSRLVEVDPVNGVLTVLYEEEGVNVFHPRVSPDGKLIVFVRNLRGMQDIYLSRIEPGAPDTGKVRPLLGNDLAGDYFPRFVDTTTVIFSSDREGSLALYTVSIGDKRFTRVLEDRIAAFDGVPTADGLVYATYRSTGYGLWKAEPGQHVSVSLQFPAEETASPPSSRPEIDSRPYWDLPSFQFWLPNAGLTDIDGVWHFSLGVYLYFASVMGTTKIDSSLLFYPSLLQPEASFRLLTEAGPVDLGYTFTHTYEAGYAGGSPVYQERFSQWLTIGLPLLNRFSHTWLDYFYVYTGVYHAYLLQSGGAFSFLNGFSPASLDSGNVLAPVGGLYFEHSKNDGVAAFFPPWSLKASFEVSAPLPLFPETASGVILIGRWSFSLPGLWPLSSLKVGLAASYTSHALLGTPFLRPRGLFPAAPQGETGRALAAADYRFTIAYTDAPLAGGFHLDGLGAGLHGELVAEFDPAAPAFTLDPYLYAGVELIILAGLGKFSLPVGLGVSARFDTSLSHSFDPGRDIAFYYFFSFDSFFSAADGRRQNPVR